MAILKYKKVTQAPKREVCNYPQKITFSSTGEVYEYSSMLPLSTHRKREFFLYLNVAPKEILGKPAANFDTILRLTKEDIDSLASKSYCQLFYDKSTGKQA